MKDFPFDLLIVLLIGFACGLFAAQWNPYLLAPAHTVVSIVLYWGVLRWKLNKLNSK